jgi:SPP1 family predicted phage head-tail adaptor
MRSGSMDRTIRIERASATVADDGTAMTSWAPVATIRAHLLQSSTEEFLRSYGETDAMAVIFRIRWRPGITTDQRVLFEGVALNIRELKEIGRRRGIELRCEEVRS